MGNVLATMRFWKKDLYTLHGLQSKGESSYVQINFKIVLPVPRQLCALTHLRSYHVESSSSSISKRSEFLECTIHQKFGLEVNLVLFYI